MVSVMMQNKVKATVEWQQKWHALENDNIYVGKHTFMMHRAHLIHFLQNNLILHNNAINLTREGLNKI